MPKAGEVLEAAAEQVGIFQRSDRILAKTIQAFASDNIVRLGAALVFYTTVALAPPVGDGDCDGGDGLRQGRSA